MTTEGEFLPGVHQISSPLGERRSSLYLFVGSARALLFDTGIDGTIPAKVIPYVQKIGLALSALDSVVISHCDVDHFGGVQDVHECLPAATVIAHELDADAMEDFETYERVRGRSFRRDYGFDGGVDDWARSVVRTGRIDRRLASEEHLDIGGRTLDIIHTPGHTRGHVSVLDSTNSFIAIGDAVLGDAVPFASGEPAFPPTYRHELSYLDSIERISNLEVRGLGTAHYGLIEGADVARFLSTSRAFAREFKRLIRDTLKGARKGFSLEQLAVHLDPTVGSWPKGTSIPALMFPIAAHLEQLESEGLVSRWTPTNGQAPMFFDNS